MATNGEQSTSVLCTVEEFLSQTYDYIVVGGGTAGLVLANRLSEDEGVTVGVLEAGPAKINDPMIMTPGFATAGMFNSETNWMMRSIPQVHNGNRRHDVPRGKVLGGSSAINYIMYTRGQKTDYDDWERMGAKGWGWNNLEPYMRKHEFFEGNASKFPHDEKVHGTSGCIHTSFPSTRCDDLEDAWMEACRASLDRRQFSPYGGDHTGIYTSLCTINQTNAKGTRSYAVTGYLLPVLERKNLKVLTEAHVSRIVLQKSNEHIRASGVEFVVGEKTYSVSTNREIILSAGSIHTPQVLELSGIGDPEVLSKAGVDMYVENKHVGANYQDHLMSGIVYNLKPGQDCLDNMHDPGTQKEVIEEYMNHKTGPLGAGQSSMGFASYRSLASDSEIKNVLDLIEKHGNLDAKENHIETNRLVENNSATIHLYGVAATFHLDAGHDGKGYFAPPPAGVTRFTMGTSLQYTFSRGSTHIESNDPKLQPKIDLGYLSHPADLAIQVTAVRFADQCFQRSPLKDKVAERHDPPPSVDLNDQNQAEEYVRTHTHSEYHPLGTAAIGKVVDERLHVYGLTGLRICDASVFPVNISGNLVATVYAVAEKAADIIKEDWKN